jgi:alpha-ribazole phosphatase
MNNVYLLRHGRTLGPAALNGSTDIAVAPQVQQAIADTIEQRELGFSHIITSPLKRCSDLAALLVKRNPALKLVTEPSFRELHFGRFDGIPFDDLKEEQELLMAFWKAPASNTLPEAEPLKEAYLRVSTAWQQQLENLQQDTLIISHGGVIRLILAHALDADWKNPSWHAALSIDYQSLTHMEIYTDAEPFVWIKSIGSKLKDA